MSEKSAADILKDKLFRKNENGYLRVGADEAEKISSYADGYKDFLDKSRTERLCARETVRLARENGFCEYDASKRYGAGDKVYLLHRDKAVILCVFGSEPLENGVKIAAAHIDSPRLDLKPNPIYESDELGYFKTHYYGGIKKYQWTAIPLMLCGVIITADGDVIQVNLGGGDEPKFVITDLLPHLAAEQSKRTLAEGIKGEELNVLIGSRPFADDETSEAVKLNILRLLNEKYGVTESDFTAAELELVPAFAPCDIGFDRSLVGGYGHDDRVCAYPAIIAALECEQPAFTAITVLTDKEEVGSDGNTGLKSAFLKNFIKDIARHENLRGYEVLRASQCLSADVNAAHDPTFPDVDERNNAAFINKGVVITKYTGSRGKSGTSDAGAEYMAYIRSMLNKNGVVWQTGELGKVDAGGGGTVAKYIANMDVDTVDLGVPVLSMHSPFEVISKLDLYMAYKAFTAFFQAAPG